VERVSRPEYLVKLNTQNEVASEVAVVFFSVCKCCYYCVHTVRKCRLQFHILLYPRTTWGGCGFAGHLYKNLKSVSQFISSIFSLSGIGIETEGCHQDVGEVHTIVRVQTMHITPNLLTHFYL